MTTSFNDTAADPSRVKTVRTIALAIGVFIYGLFAVNNSGINVLSINWADNWLHLVSCLAGLVVALLPVRARARAAAA